MQTKKEGVFPIFAVGGREVAGGARESEDRMVGVESAGPYAQGSPVNMTFIILFLGLGVGVLVGLLGIGGGVVLVPTMVYFLHMDQHLAQGTSLFILLPPVGLGALREYWKQGQVDLLAGILCALGLFGAYAGSLVALPMPTRTLQGLFGAFLLLAGFLLWRKAQLESPAASGTAGKRTHG